MKPETEWALVADAQRRRILERQTPAGASPELTEEAVGIHNRPSRERGSERPGRTQESATSARHAIEPKTDPHREAKQRFAQHLADGVEEAAGRDGRLLPVAPPPFRRDLRAALGAAAQQRLAGSLDKDRTKHKLPELAPLLAQARPLTRRPRRFAGQGAAG
jgi:protein required for attachment to host cells